MLDTIEDAAPFFFAAEQPPTAVAIDEDIYLTVTTALPDRPGEVEPIDIILSLEYAEHVVAQLSDAISAARRNERN